MALASASLNSIQSALRLSNSELYASAAANTFSQNSLSQLIVSQRLPPPIALKEPPTPPSKQESKDKEDEEESQPSTSDDSDQPQIPTTSILTPNNQLSASILLPQTSPLYPSLLPFIQPSLIDFNQQIAQQNCMQMAAFQQTSLNGTPILLSPNLAFQQQMMANQANLINKEVNNQLKEVQQNPIEKSIMEQIKIEAQQAATSSQPDLTNLYSRPIDLSTQISNPTIIMSNNSSFSQPSR